MMTDVVAVDIAVVAEEKAAAVVEIAAAVAAAEEEAGNLISFNDLTLHIRGGFFILNFFFKLILK